MSQEALRDGNHVTTIIVESSVTPGATIRLKGDETTGALLVKVVT